MEESLFTTFTPVTSGDIINGASQYYNNNNIPTNPFMDKLLSTTRPKIKDTEPLSKNTTDVRSLIEGITYESPTFQVPQVSTLDKGTSATSKHIIDFFKSKGLTSEQGAAIAGNFKEESGLNTGSVGDKHLATPSIGLGQWREGRLANLKAFAQSRGKDFKDLDTQLEFTWHELNTSENKALKALLGARDVTTASRAFAHNYERMAQYSPKREQSAKQFLLNYYNKA